MLLPLRVVVAAQSPAYAEWLFCTNAASLCIPSSMVGAEAQIVDVPPLLQPLWHPGKCYT